MSPTLEVKLETNFYTIVEFTDCGELKRFVVIEPRPEKQPALRQWKLATYSWHYGAGKSRIGDLLNIKLKDETYFLAFRKEGESITAAVNRTLDDI